MKKSIKNVISFVICVVIALWIGKSSAIFLAGLANRSEEVSVKKANRLLPLYEYKSDLPESSAQNHIFEKHNFAVFFSKGPQVSNWGQMVQYEFGEEAEPVVYNILITPQSELLLSNKAIDAHLEGYIYGRKKTFGNSGELLESRKVLFLDHAALDYEYTKEVDGYKSFFKGLYFVDGHLAYTISVSCIEEMKTKAYQKYDEFIRSFRLITPMS